MEEKHNILNELNEISPRLSEIEKRTEFKIPDGYFENFPDQIMNLIEEKNSGKNTMLRNKFQKWQIYSIAAVLALVASFAFLKYKTDKKNDLYQYFTTEDYILTNCSESFLIEYIEENQLIEEADIYSDIDLEQFDTDLLIEEL